MTIPIRVSLTVEESVQQYHISASDTNIPIKMEVETPIVAGVFDTYDGPYSVTPSADEQTLQTNDLHMADNIVIAPIPQNYGLITYNGSTITVS